MKPYFSKFTRKQLFQKHLPKKGLCALLLSFSLLSLTGCHGQKGLDAFELPDTFDTTREYEITFWAKNDTNKAQADTYRNAISTFESLYPNIKVNLRLYTDYLRIYNDVITNLSTRTTPNVCITYPDHIATYLSGINTVVPLDELIYDETYGFGGSSLLYDSPTPEEIVPEFLQECVIHDATYALPFMRSTEACYINQDMVEQLGYQIPDVLTWDFVWEVSEAACKKDADGNYLINGQKVMIPFIYKSTDNMMIQVLKQQNAPYSTADGEIQIFHDTTRDFLYEIAKHTKSGAFSTFKISSYPANFLNAGQCIFAIDSTAGSTWMGSKAPLLDISADAVKDFKTAVRMVPQFDSEHPSMISQGPSVCIFNKEDPQEVLASWLFTQFLLSNEVQLSYAKTEGYLPVTTKAHQSKEYQDYLSRSGEDNSLYYDVKIESTKLLLAHTKDTFVTPVFNGSASLREAAGTLIENTVKGTNRQATVNEQFLEEQFQSVISLYHLDQNNTSALEKKELGALPLPSLLFLSALCVTWGILLLFVIINRLKTKKTTT